MLGIFLAAWIVAPLVVLAVSLGCGLLVRWAAAGDLPSVYVLPVGFALAIAVSAMCTTLDATAELAGPAIVLLAVVGLVLGRGVLRFPGFSRAWVLPGVAAVAAFATIAAPVVLSGQPGFTGYSRIVDIAHQFDFSAYLATKGRVNPSVVDSSYLEMAIKTLAIGYPGGWQSILGAFSRLTFTDLVWIYQPLLAMTAAMLALSIYGLLQRAVASPLLRAVAAGAAAQANVLYASGVVGGFKELSAASCLILTLGLLQRAAMARHWRSAAPAAVGISASLASLNLTVVPWLGIFVAGTILLALWRAPRRLLTIPRVAALGAMVLVLSLPTVIEAGKLAPVAAQASGSNRTVLADLGNLAEPMPFPAAAGVWLTRDYRFADNGKSPATYTLVAIVLALSLVGIAASAWRRDWPIVLLGGGALVALAYFRIRTGPWLQFKAIVISAPMVLTCAFAGAGAIYEWAKRLPRQRSLLGVGAAWALALVTAGGVLAGNALAYHDTTLAPAKRLHDLEEVGHRLKGQGPTLYPAHEEYAEYFLRDAKGTSTVNPPRGGPGFPQIRDEAFKRVGGTTSYAWDLDDLKLGWVERFPWIVVRRGPSRSRPPSNYRLGFKTPYVEAWRRVEPGRRIVAHFPAPTRRARAKTCRAVSRAVAEHPDATLLYARLAPALPLRLASFDHSGNWGAAPGGLLLTAGQGEVGGHFKLPVGGRYRVWLGGDFGRAIEVAVDRREVGTLKNRHDYPQQYSLAGEVALRNGRHSFLIQRAGGDLAPGNSSGDEFPIGPLALELITPDPNAVRRASLSSAGSICRTMPRLDWIELLRRG